MNNIGEPNLKRISVATIIITGNKASNAQIAAIKSKRRFIE